jgi:hypothetical protein
MKKVDLTKLDDAAKAVLDKICTMATGFPAADLVKQGGISAVQSFADMAVEFADAAGPEAIQGPTA